MSDGLQSREEPLSLPSGTAVECAVEAESSSRPSCEATTEKNKNEASSAASSEQEHTNEDLNKYAEE